MYKKLGLFFGTFDPVHNGHLHIAKGIQKQLGLEQVLLIPLKDIPHKNNVTFSLETRIKLCECASNRGVQTSSIMASFDICGYDVMMIDLVKSLYRAERYYYIMGSDVFKHILSWRNLDELLSQVTITVALRCHNDQEAVLDVKASVEKMGGHVEIVEMDYMAISSSDIKAKLMKENTYEGLPDAVIQCLKKMNL